MIKVISVMLLAMLSTTAIAKCGIMDFKSNWQILMTFSQLNSPDGEHVAQRGGSITCDVRFDKRGNYVAEAENSCRQDGLNYSFGQLRDARVELPVTADKAGSCRFQITLDFDLDSASDTRTVILPRVTLDRSKGSFAAELDVIQTKYQVWRAGSSWGFKPLQH